MKWIIYLLLVFNIGFAAWHFRGLDSREDGSRYALDISNENQLVLLSELKQKKEQERLSQEGAKLCYSLGPLQNRGDAEKVEKIFKDKNMEYHRIQLRDSSRQGYWVILPATPTRKEANAHIRKLKQLKVDDYFLVATGDHMNAISLGVFSQKKLARNRVDEMIRLGFVPRMERVALPRKVYWLNWYKDSEKQLGADELKKIQDQFGEIKTVERSCK